MVASKIEMRNHGIDRNARDVDAALCQEALKLRSVETSLTLRCPASLKLRGLQTSSLHVESDSLFCVAACISTTWKVINLIKDMMAQLEKVSSSEVPCLLMGESGTGKEVIARAIQMLSKRSDGPFVTVDCGAFSPNLVASELFGHEKGAFTGADRQHVGAFERAHGGVLFLDEIGELPLDLQPQLLGALERRRFRRLGGQREIDVDVQLVSATNRDLRVEVNEGTFRLDLYYRLAVVVLRLPSLRDRRDDVPLLVEHFLRDAGHDGPVTDVVPDEIMAGLKAHRWPGNVRELRNWVEATVAMGEAGELMSHEPRGMNATADDGELLVMPYKEARFRVLEDFERRYLERLIERARHNVSAAAREARMDRSYLLKLLQRHGLR